MPSSNDFKIRSSKVEAVLALDLSGFQYKLPIQLLPCKSEGKSNNTATALCIAFRLYTDNSRPI